MNAKTQFVLYVEYLILGMALMLYGVFVYSQSDISSLSYFGIGFANLANVFSVRLQADHRKWKFIAFSTPILFITAAAFIFRDSHRPESSAGNPNWLFFSLLCVVCLGVFFWEISKEYRAMGKSLNTPPKVEPSDGAQNG